MFVTKCDICEKEIKGDAVLADVGRSISRQAFCLECGKPVLKFLNKVEKKKNGKQKTK